MTAGEVEDAGVALDEREAFATGETPAEVVEEAGLDLQGDDLVPGVRAGSR